MNDTVNPIANPIERIMLAAPVIPVIVIEDLATARPLAEALVKGGLPVLEVTMRTPAALDAIREMKKVPGAIVGAGTVINPGQFAQVMDAGAEFIVSPGLTELLVRSRASRPAARSGRRRATRATTPRSRFRARPRSSTRARDRSSRSARG